MPSLREPRWGVSPAPNLTIRCLAFDESSNHDLVLVGVNGGHCAYALGAADGAVRATLPLHAPSSNPVVDDDCQATAIVSIPRHYAAVVACGTTGRHAVVDLLSATYVASFGCAVASGRRGSEAEATVVSLAVTDNDRRLVSASSSSITVWAYDVWPTFSVVASATISNASGAVKRAFFCTPTTIGATLTTKELKVWSMCSVGTSQTKLHDLVPVEVPPPPVQVAHAHRVAPVKGCERVLAVSDCGDWVVGWISTPSPFHPKTTITWQNSSSDATTMMHLAPAVANQGTATVMLTPRDIAILSFTGTPQLTVVDTVTAQSSTESIALPPTQVMASSQRHQLLLTAHAQSLLALPITLDAAPPLSNDSDLHHADAMPSMPRVMIDRGNDVYIRCVDWSPSEFGNFSVEYSYVNKDPAQVHRSVVVGFREVQSVMCVRRDTRLVASHVPRSHDYCSLPLRPINATQWALLGRELATADFCLATVPNADASLSDQPEWVTAWACANHTIECARSEDRKAVASAMCVQAAVLGELGDRGTAANRREWCHIFLDGHATQLQRLKAAVRVDPLCSEGWLALATWEPPAAATSGSNFCAAPCNAARNGCHGGLDDEVEEDPLDEEDEAPLDRLGCALKAVEMLPDEAKAWEALCECFALHPALQVEVGLAQGIAPDANAAKTAIISEAHALCQYLSLRCDDAAAWARLAKVSWPSRYVELGPRTLDDSPLMYGGGERAELPTMVPADCSWRASELGFKSPSYLAAFW